MNTFFYITDILFDSIERALSGLFSWVSTITGALALAFLVVIIVSIFNKGVNKKFFINNNKFLTITLILEIISSLLSADANLIKVNLLAICVCLLLILYRTSFKTKKKDPYIIDVEVKRRKR